MKRSKGFTLIELLAVIVILAIIALIATPMVLKYIDNAKEGSNDISVESILRAADNYYASSLLDKNTTYPISFDLSSKEDISKLGLKGDTPDEGTLEIYKDGTTFIEAMYDDVIYVKLPNETKVTKNPKIIGDSTTWTTDGSGKITKFTQQENSEYQFQLFASYVHASYLYAVRDNSGSTLDFSKSLSENIALAEEAEQISRSSLPLELNKEVDAMLVLFNTETQLDSTAAMALFTNNEATIPNAADLMVNLNNSNDNFLEYKAYQTILEYNKLSDVFVIPNYIKHEDGTLEKITTIGSTAIAKASSLTCSIAPSTPSEQGKSLIISYGITSIEKNAFYACLLNNVTLPISIETIGEAAFRANRLTTVKIPYKVETLEKNVFATNRLNGEIVIPKNVKTIAANAFWGEVAIAEGTDCEKYYNYSNSFGVLCEQKGSEKNSIENVTFEEESKIMEIESGAFNNNNIISVTIPGSIKSIGYNAFNCSTLTSATIQRSQGSDLTVASNAFGSITPTYKS